MSLPMLAAAACSASSSNGNTPQPKSDPLAPVIDGAAIGDVAKVDLSKLPETGPARTPKAGFVGSDDPISRDTLRFKDEAAAATYDKLVGCFARYGEEWTAYPLRRYGNFVNVEWCRGEGSNINCGGGNTRTAPGAGWGSVSVLHYERDWPEVYGLSFTTGQIPKNEGIAASLSWTRGGQSVVGDSSRVTFQEVVDGAIVSKLSLGMNHGFTVGEDEVSSQTKGTASDFYRRLVESPESLRKEATAQLAGLEAAVEGALTADTPRKCVYGPYKGGGIPPECIRKEPLDASEKAEVRAALGQTLTMQRALIDQHSAAMHGALLELMPSECWVPQS
jgi:hypothetical protein